MDVTNGGDDSNQVRSAISHTAVRWHFNDLQFAVSAILIYSTPTDLEGGSVTRLLVSSFLALKGDGYSDIPNSSCRSLARPGRTDLPNIIQPLYSPMLICPKLGDAGSSDGAWGFIRHR